MKRREKKVTMLKLELMVVRWPRLAILAATPQPKPEPDTEGREVVQAVSRGAKMQTAKGKVLGN